MKRKIEMSEIPIGIAASEGVVLAVLTHLKHGKIDDAIAEWTLQATWSSHLARAFLRSTLTKGSSLAAGGLHRAD